ncbi:MAG: patatin-like phospholipase family protein [Oligoflexus sp.]
MKKQQNFIVIKFLILNLYFFPTLQVLAEEKASSPDESRPLVLTVSGGVSLGAYEGGYVYYLAKQLSQLKLTNLKVVTGASAGSINALMAAMLNCSNITENPEESLPWKVWIPVGLNKLSEIADVTPISIFSRNALQNSINHMADFWSNGLSSDCDIAFGVSVTRKKPLHFQLRKEILISRHHEQFVFRIRGRGPNQAPIIENLMLHNPKTWQPVLPFNGNAEHDFKLFMSVLEASTSFPLAFPPKPIHHCLIQGTADPKSCNHEKAETYYYLDGGVFDNTPLRLAHQITQFLYPDKAQQNQLLYAVITAGEQTHPISIYNESVNKDGIFDFVTGFASDVIETARGKEISFLLQEAPHFERQLLVNTKLLPPAGSYYYAFSGFIDQGFREFDFYLGMWEAQFLLRQGLAEQGFKTSFQTRLKEMLENTGSPLSTWNFMACFTQLIEPSANTARHCELAQASHPAHSILIDTISDLVTQRCAASSVKSQDYYICRQLRPSLQFSDSKRQIKDFESDRDYFFRRLKERNYPFELAGMTSDGPNILRSSIYPIVSKLAQYQSELESILVSNGSEIFLDTLYYTSPRTIQYFQLGTAASYGMSSRLSAPESSSPWYHGEVGVLAQGISSYLGRTRDILSLTPYTGILWELKPSRRGLFRHRLGLRFGYQFSNDDNGGREACDTQQAKDLSYACSQPTLHPFYTLTFLDRARFEVVYQTFPWAEGSRRGELSVMFGFQRITY